MRPKTLSFSLKKIAFPSIFLLIFGIGIYARVQAIHHDFWLDELATAWVINDSFAKIFERCWISNLSPLYYLLVYLSKILFGYSESSLRLPSIIAGVLIIPVIYIFTYRLSRSKSLGIFAAFLSSLDYVLIFYSYEARPYSLVQLFTLLQLYFFFHFLCEKPNLFYGIILGLLSGIIVLLHYTAGIIFIVETFLGIIYFIYNRNFSRAKLTTILICFLLLVIFSIPILEHISYLYKQRNILGSFIKSRSVLSVFTILPHLEVYILLPIILTIFIGYTAKIKIIENILDNFKSFELFFLFSWYFLPILILWWLATVGIVNVYLNRYLSWICLSPIICSSILIGVLRTKKAKRIFIVSLLLSTQLLYNPTLILLIKGQFKNSVDYKNKFDWKEAVEKINKLEIAPSKLYIRSDLVEAKRIKNSSNDNQLLNDYLLSPVTSMYKLRNKYIDRAVPISSIFDVPDSTSNFLLIGRKINYEEVVRYFDHFTELSPEDAVVKIFFISRESNALTK